MVVPPPSLMYILSIPSLPTPLHKGNIHFIMLGWKFWYLSVRMDFGSCIFQAVFIGIFGFWGLVVFFSGSSLLRLSSLCIMLWLLSFPLGELTYYFFYFATSLFWSVDICITLKKIVLMFFLYSDYDLAKNSCHIWHCIFYFCLDLYNRRCFHCFFIVLCSEPMHFCTNAHKFEFDSVCILVSVSCKGVNPLSI